VAGPDRPDPPASEGGVSIATVAARAGVSIATVSRVVNGVTNKASAETVRRVREAVADLGYRPMSAGRALRRGESRLVAILAANLANPSQAAVAASAETALREAGLVMVLCDTHDRPELQDEYLLEMRAQRARATVFLGAVASPQLTAARTSASTMLFVNRRCPDGDAPFVGIDNRAAGADVAAFLLDRGIADPAVIHGPIASSATADRLAGFRARLAAAGVALADARVTTAPGLDHLRIGHAATARLMALDPRPRAIFCLSDLMAYGARRCLAEMGLEVPRDVLVIGFDDNPLNDWVAPWLVSVRVPYERYGTAVVEALTALWQGRRPGAVLLPHQMVVRGAPAA
jgi:LacI family transcriptional regulator